MTEMIDDTNRNFLEAQMTPRDFSEYVSVLRPIAERAILHSQSGTRPEAHKRHASRVLSRVTERIIEPPVGVAATSDTPEAVFTAFNWQEGAACLPDRLPPTVDVEDFHAEGKGKKAAHDRAKAICKGDDKRGIPACPVKDFCLEDALERDDRFAVRGGYDAVERKALKRDQKRV